MDDRRLGTFSTMLDRDMSRRHAVGRFGAIAAALVATASLAKARAAAQEASPEPGLPPGVALTPLIGVMVDDMPPAPVTVQLTRGTLEPGASVPESSYSYPEIAYVEAGTMICPGGAQRFVFLPDGTVRVHGEGDVTVATGEAIYVPANVADGARNDGTEQLSVLLIDFVPAEGVATPTA